MNAPPPEWADIPKEMRPDTDIRINTLESDLRSSALTAQQAVQRALAGVDPAARSFVVYQAAYKLAERHYPRNECESLFSEAQDHSLVHAAHQQHAADQGRAAHGGQLRIPGYDLDEERGRGGQAIVYKATHTQRGEFAVKTLLPKFRDSQVDIERFHREARYVKSLAALKHPNIVQVVEIADEQSPIPYIVMELLPGPTLDVFVSQNSLNIRQIVGLIKTVATTVGDVARKGFIHRDLKPSNILMNADNDPVLLDFGLAKRGAGAEGDDTQSASLTETGQFMGSYRWISPEHLSENGSDLDTRSDVYSLGVILYSLLTDKHTPYPKCPVPLEDLRPGDLRINSFFHSVLSEDRVSPRHHNTAIERNLETIVLKCIERDPGRRYDTAGELADDLGRYLNGEPIRAKQASELRKLQRRLNRNRTLLAASALVGAVLLVSLLVVSRALNNEADAKRAAEASSVKERHQRQVAEAQQALAEQREKETRQVADFQAKIFSDLDAEAIGRGIVAFFREQLSISLERQKFAPWLGEPLAAGIDIDRELATFDERVGAIQVADIARRVVDTYFLKPTIDASEREFHSQPLVAARIQNAVAEAYLNLGLYAASEEQFEAARNARMSQLGADHEDTLESMSNVAAALKIRADYANSEAAFREVLDRRRRVLGDESVQVARVLNNLGSVLRARASNDEAEAVTCEALAIYRKVLGDDSRETLAAQNNLATSLHAQGKYLEAEQVLRENLTHMRQLFGDRDAEVAQTIMNLGAVIRDQGNLGAAEPLFRESLQIWREVRGEEHPDVIFALGNLENLLRKKHDYAAAEPLTRERLALTKKLMGPSHPDTISAMAALGDLFRAKENYAEAETIMREALKLTLIAFGDDHPETATAIANVAVVVWKRGDLKAAESLFRQALEIQRRILPSDHPRLAKTLHDLASVLQDDGNDLDAEPLYRESLAIYQSRFPASHPDTGGTLFRFGRTLLRLGRFHDAEPQLLGCYENLSLQKAPSQRFLRMSIEELINLYGAWELASPGEGHAAKSSKWRARLEHLEPTSQSSP